MKDHVAILCGGSTYEHEVSIITGIQVAEALDKTKYTFSFVYFDKDNNTFLIKDFKNRKDFKRGKRLPVDIVKREDGVYLELPTRFNKKQKVHVCYLAFHGGSGESGSVQGMLELYGVPFTSASQEGVVISMNKALTKEVLLHHNIPTLDFISVTTENYNSHKSSVLKEIKQKLSLPVIIKPVHLGSSIAIEVAHNEVELEKFLNVAVRVDNEVLVEPALTDFTEFNVSARTKENEIELSPIEEPKREEEILSFEDKYTKGGGKKTGPKQGGGMELLDRTVPAKISPELEKEINQLTKRVYRACRLSGLLRIDFMYSESQLYCTEINPIPGSMAFYLWEANGEQFKEQVTNSLEDAMNRFRQRIKIIPYETDIVDKFIG